MAQARVRTGNGPMRVMLVTGLVAAVAILVGTAPWRGVEAAPDALAPVRAGEAAFGRGDLKGAQARWEEALSRLARTASPDVRARLLSHLGRVSQRRGQLVQGLRLQQEALAAAQGDRSGDLRALVTFRLAMAQDHLGQFAQALATLDQAMTLSTNPRALAQVQAGRGMVLLHQGRYGEAMKVLEGALAGARTTKNVEAEALALDGLGLALYYLGRHPQAVASLAGGRAAWERVPDLLARADSTTWLGLACQASGEYDRAMDLHREALAVLTTAGAPGMEATVRDNMGLFQVLLGNYEGALEQARISLAIRRRIGDRGGEQIALGNVGAAQARLKRYDESLATSIQALAVAKEIGDLEGQGVALSNAMLAAHALHREATAVLYGKMAVNTWQSMRQELQHLDRESQDSFLKRRESTYRDLAAILIDLGRLPEAQQVIEALKGAEYERFIRSASASAPGAALSLNPAEQAIQERYATVADRVVSLGKERQALLSRSILNDSDEKRLLAIEKDIQAINAEFELYLSRLGNEFGASHEQVVAIRTSAALQETLRSLGPGVVVVYTLVGRDRLRLVLVTADIQKKYEVPVGAVDLSRKVFDHRQAMKKRADTLPTAQDLYRCLCAPMRADLDALGTRTIMWSLDGVLRYVPVSALHDGKRFLVESYGNPVFTVVTPVSLREMPTRPWRAAGLGVSKALAGHESLPAVPSELQGIIRTEAVPAGAEKQAGVLPGVIHLDSAFTREAFERVLVRRFPVIHIASHFDFVPGAESQSALLLGDGSLLDLATLKSWRFEGVQLLTLSACNTATGQGSSSGGEIESFATLAQNRGAHAVLATLWPVSDESTGLLMREFYRLHEGRNDITRMDSLRLAQIRLLRGPQGTREKAEDYSHPFHWAPFILVGNWR